MAEVFDESVVFTSRASTASDVFDDAAVLDGNTTRVSTTSDGLDTVTASAPALRPSATRCAHG